MSDRTHATPMDTWYVVYSDSITEYRSKRAARFGNWVNRGLGVFPHSVLQPYFEQVYESLAEQTRRSED